MSSSCRCDRSRPEIIPKANPWYLLQFIGTLEVLKRPSTATSEDPTASSY